MDLNDPPKKYIISEEPDFCEECGEVKPIIIRIKRRYIAEEWFCKHIGHFTKDMRK